MSDRDIAVILERLDHVRNDIREIREYAEKVEGRVRTLELVSAADKVRWGFLAGALGAGGAIGAAVVKLVGG